MDEKDIYPGDAEYKEFGNGGLNFPAQVNNGLNIGKPLNPYYKIESNIPLAPHGRFNPAMSEQNKSRLATLRSMSVGDSVAFEGKTEYRAFVNLKSTLHKTQSKRFAFRNRGLSSSRQPMWRVWRIK